MLRYIWNLEYWKYTVFRTFLLHALTYWAEILHMTLFYCNSDQIRVSSICVNFCGSNAPFGTKNTGNTQFFAFFFLHALTYWAEILHMTLFCRTTYQVWVTLIFVGVTPLLDLRILEIHSIPHFSLTCFDILSWNYTYVFVLLYYRLSSSVVISYQFL